MLSKVTNLEISTPRPPVEANQRLIRKSTLLRVGESKLRYLILVMFSLVLGLLIVFLIRYVASVMVWVIVVLAALGSIGWYFS